MGRLLRDYNFEFLWLAADWGANNMVLRQQYCRGLMPKLHKKLISYPEAHSLSKVMDYVEAIDRQLQEYKLDNIGWSTPWRKPELLEYTPRRRPLALKQSMPSPK